MKLQQEYLAPNLGDKLTPEQAMKMAIGEAYKGATAVSPNPLVGSVVLDSAGYLLASGYHERYGGPHAEVNAVKNLSSEQLKGATVFVTLEPCAHEGKTPSCAKMLAKLPIKKVIFGLIDPNPLVAGQGAAILRAAGIEAEVFQASLPEVQTEFKNELEQVCEVFLCNYLQKKTFVALKVATSLDGKMALTTGQSKWITGPESREYSHFLRACYDAILVGKGTVLADDPSLDIRHPIYKKENKVIVIDPYGEILKNLSQYKISTIHRPENLFFVVAEDLDLSQNTPALAPEVLAQVIFVRSLATGMLDLREFLNKLFQLGIRSLFVEGGAQTLSEFVTQQLADRIYVFQAPILMGTGLSWTQSLELVDLKDKLDLFEPKMTFFGKDFMVTGRLNMKRKINQ